MSEFLHHVVANREYRQHDVELGRVLREQMSEGWQTVFNTDTDPWAEEEHNNG
jgi:hypothetical protein